MKCRYCNDELAPLRSLTDGEFCSDEHRSAFELASAKQKGTPNSGEIARGKRATREKTASQDPRPAAQNLSAFDFAPPARTQSPSSPSSSSSSAGWTQPEPDTAAQPSSAAWLGSSAGVFDDVARSGTANFRSAQAEAEGEASSGEVETPENAEAGAVHPSQESLGPWQWLSAAWQRSPRDLKILLVLFPVLVALAIGPSVTKVKIGAPAPPAVDNVQQIVVTQFKGLQQSISNRAAIAFADDFRSGLDAWLSRSNLTRSWSYDTAGFVRPGPLAIFKPTTDLSDYRFEFLEEIDQKALGCAFRAADLENYYAVKLVVVQPGPLPVVHLVRYPVINGKEGRHVEKPLPFTTQPDTLYRMLVDVRGSDFTIMIQGQVVDFWSDDHLARGGVGFFCGRGERARLRWVEVSHQYDALGRLCAYLAPYGIDGKNGDLN